MDQPLHLRKTLRLMERQEQLKPPQLEELRLEIQNGLTNGEPVAWNPEFIQAEARALLQAPTQSNQDPGCLQIARVLHGAGDVDQPFPEQDQP